MASQPYSRLNPFSYSIIWPFQFAFQAHPYEWKIHGKYYLHDIHW